MILAVAVVAVASAAQAAPASLQAAWLGEVRPGARRYFHVEGEGGALRRTRAYVVPGDRVVATAAREGFTAVTFVAPGGRLSTGWIESRALLRVDAPATGWTGSWKGGDATIDIKPGPRAGSLILSGEAIWGSHDPERVARGGVHTGAFEAELVQPRGDWVGFSATEEPEETAAYDVAPQETFRCRVALRRLGPYLLAEDNTHCGGVNVTFTGVYRRG